MINPWALLLWVALVIGLDRVGWAKPVFKYLPVPFWCYMGPMTMASAGLLPAYSPMYGLWTSYGLAACLVLLLLGSRPRDVWGAGGPGLAAMVAGSVGIAAGAVAAQILWGSRMPADAWKGLGSLSASWTGGSANMVAVKEILGTPESIFAPLVVVDSVGTYTWMALLVAASSFQEEWNRRVGAAPLDALRQERDARSQNPEAPAGDILLSILLVWAAFAIGALCLRAGDAIPYTTPALTSRTWAILLVTAVGIGLAFTPAARWAEPLQATRHGTWLLYVLLATLGARARWSDLAQAPVYLLCGATVLTGHAIVLGLYGWWRRVPLALLATASQANVGGVASTPIVAGLYDARLAPLGLLLALAGNLAGTYAGLGIAFSCRFFQP